MGIYLNPTNEKFDRALISQIYVDKSMSFDYGCQNDSHSQFDSLKIAKEDFYEKHSCIIEK